LLIKLIAIKQENAVGLRHVQPSYGGYNCLSMQNSLSIDYRCIWVLIVNVSVDGVSY